MQDSNTPAVLITAGVRRIEEESIRYIHSEEFYNEFLKIRLAAQ